LKLLSRRTREPRVKVSWWTPYWFHVPRTWRTWRQLLRPRAIARITVFSVALGAVMIAVVKAANPMIQLPPVWKMLLALPAFYGYVLVMLLVHAALPSHVEVRKDRMHAMTGQSHWVVKSEAVRRTRIVVFAVHRVRLRVFYFHKGRVRSRTLGVAGKLNLDELANALAVYPEVWNAQDRYCKLRGA
jgi:hypothetical protein